MFAGFRHQVSLVSTTRRAKLVILTIAVTGFSLCSYPLWTIGVRTASSGRLKCLIKDPHGATGTAYKRWNAAVLMFGTLFIPGTIIAVITGVIVAILARAARRRAGMQMDGQVGNITNIVYYNQSSCMCIWKVKKSTL